MKNKCNSLRYSAGLPVLNVHFNKLNRLHVLGSDTVKSVNTIHSDDFELFMQDGTSIAELDFDVDFLEVTISFSWSQAFINGNCTNAFYHLKGAAQINAQGLNVLERLTVIHRGVGPLVCKAPLDYFKVQINSLGDVLYSGETNTIELIDLGEGEINKRISLRFFLTIKDSITLLKIQST